MKSRVKWYIGIFCIIKVTKVKIDVFFVDFADFAVFLPILDYVVFDVEFGGLPPLRFSWDLAHSNRNEKMSLVVY